MKLQPTKVYEIVDVNVELPKEDGLYTVLSKCNGTHDLQTHDTLIFSKGSFQNIPNWEHIHWLKETNDKYLLSKEDIEAIYKLGHDVANCKHEPYIIGDRYNHYLNQIFTND